MTERTEKKLMTKHYRKKKQYCKAMEPAEKKYHWRKKQFRDMKYKQEIQKNFPKNTKH